MKNSSEKYPAEIAESLKQASQYYQSGVAFQQQGRFDEAVSCFQQAAQLNPNDANIYVWLGILFQDRGRSDEAISYYRKALELKPDYAEVYNNIGNVYKDQGRFDEAVSYYRKALAQKPELAEAYGSIGNVLQDQGRVDEAISYYQKALNLKPNLAEAYHSMGTALQDQGKFGEAVSYYRKALESEPNHGHACGSLVFLLKHTCGWHLLESFAEKHLDELTKKALDNGLKSPESPFLSLMRHDDPARHLAIARSHARDISARMSNLNMSFSFDERKRDKSKIALGYISGDFRDHPVGHLTAGLFRYHHREEFQVFCYSYGANDNSVYRKQISQECDKFLDIREMSHTDAAKRIYEDKVDILIDLTGYTWGNRIGICALRPAPVQVSWLGFSGTSGADFFDYIVADKTVTPAHHSVYYTERFVFMPHGYMIGGNQAISDRQWRKADFGLPENAFVFCSFNQAYKIDPRLFDTWMKILRQVPESVLWLMGENKSAEEKLKQAAESRGVNPERLIFAKKLPSKSDHLARLKLADIALDTRVYNGHTTTVDALWAGLPVIALQGRHFASRSSSSLLQAAGLPELITRRLSRYESLAVRLASHPDALETIRIKLAQNHLTQPLFDLSRFVRNLESAYKEMWAIFRQGEKPRQIEVTESEDAESLHHLALSEHQKGSNDEALRLLIRARDIQPENFSYHFSLGYVLQSVGRSDEAVASYRKVIELKPDYAAAYYNMGNALLDQQKPDEAIVCYQKATEIKPDYMQAVNNMGNAYKRQGGWEEAVLCYQKSLEMNPNQADTWYNMGNTFHEQGRADEAISCYHKSLELNPSHDLALNSLVYLRQCLCDWQHLGHLTDKLDELTRKSLNSGTTPGEKPFENIGRHTDLSLNFAVAEAWARAIANSVSQWKSHLSFNHKKSSKKKITLAYLSNDFYDHPIAHLASGLFGLHNRNEFEVLCYAYGPDDGSFYRKRIQETCDKFADIRNLTYIDSAKRIYEDGADILIDLTGYTAGNRLGICALRPAPIQITYLGFAGTSGADFFDYIITDRIVTPQDHAAYYSEKFVYMPNAYMINDNTLPVSEKVLSKAEFGLPEQAFVFCSFNNTYKIEPLMFDVWMRMLQKIQGSVLWLSERNQTVEKHLKQEAENRGVNPERIVFAKRLPSKSEHLARHKLADLVLDTRIFNGHTTTADALWAGLPVITLQGSHFASRVSASLLTAIGLPELITHNLDEYEKLAIRLASHPEQLQAIRQKLAQNRLTEPLFDTSRFVRDLESAYKEMWMMFLSGEKPRQIEVKEIRNASAMQAETAEDYYKTGVAFKHQGNLNQALSCFQKALELKPDFPEVYVYIGNILQAQGSTDKAMTAYEKAVELKPDFAIAHNNMGNIFKNQRKREEAISCYRKALEADPNLAAACNNLVFDLQLSCLWQELAAVNSRLDQFTKSALADGKKPDEDPFVNLTRHADPALNFAVAKAWSHETAAYVSYLRDIYKPERFSFDERRKSEKTKIRVGYLSNTFYNHPGTHLILGLFGLHSRDEFEVFCYSYGKQEKGYYRTLIEKDCDHFADTSKLNALDAAALIYKDEIDILVDLRGYTEGNTLLVPALRPAPIQVVYLGFPGTTGADFFDYILTDRIVTPPEHADYYSEKFVYLPHCYQINDHRQPIAEKEWKRADFGLPEHAFVFCSFTRGYKIEPVMFDVWMKILRQVPGSVLWLLPGSRTAENALKQEAKARGVNSRRLIFANVLPKAQHLARQKLADLMLDTRIYNGHTTSSDALWAGLPLITLQGSHFASGVSASILTAIGLPKLITHSLEEYENLAVRLASHPEELQAICRKLAQHRLTEPLFDTPRFVRNLESAYKEMRRIFISGEKPRRIEVNEEIFPSETRSSVSAVDVERELRNAVQYHQKGQLTEAEDIYRKILERHPNHADALHLSGLAAHQNGKHDLAVNLIQKAIQQKPDNPAYYSNLALVFKAQGKLDETIFCLQKVLQFKPEDADTYHHLGTCCADYGRFDDAVFCYQKALKFKPDFVEAHSNLGNVLIDLGRLDEAIDCYCKVLKIRPNFPAAIAGQAKVLMRKGEFEAAYRLILPVAMSRTKDIETALTYARLASRFQQHREAAAFIENLLASTETKAEKSSLCFCLGDIYDAMGDYERALRCYTEANTLRHWKFDSKQHKRYISALIKIYNSGQKISMTKADNRSELPVFIVGMPRSGTTLTEQILASHPRVFGAGELPDIEATAHELSLSPNAELPDSDYLNSLTCDMLDKFANRYLERLRTFSDEASRITNKLPQNFLYLGLIAQLFPNARIIHCVRDARDTALSLYFQNFTGSHSYSFDLKNIGEYYSQYRRIMRHWKEIFQIPMLELRYEELVSDHERVIRDMLAYLGLEWNEKCLRFYESKRAVVTASYQGVREPLHTRAAGRWKNYEKYLKPFFGSL